MPLRAGLEALCPLLCVRHHALKRHPLRAKPATRVRDVRLSLERDIVATLALLRRRATTGRRRARPAICNRYMNGNLTVVLLAELAAIRTRYSY